MSLIDTYGRKLWRKSAPRFFNARYSADGVISQFDLSTVLPEKPSNTDYRLYVAEWAARKAAKADGLFVAIGAATGIHVRRILERVKPENPYWLVDAWDGRRSRDDASVKYPQATSFEAVQDSFAAYPTVHFLRGLIPDVLPGLPNGPIAFAYLALGDPESEIAALKLLMPRLARGGIFVISGFGRDRTSDEQRRQFLAIAGDNPPLVNPAGMALIFG